MSPLQPQTYFYPAAFDGASLSACRQWLRQLQTFVMALQRDVDAFALEAATRTRRAAAIAAGASSSSSPLNPTEPAHSPPSSSSASRRRTALLAATTSDLEIMGLPSLTSWPEFLANVSTQFDSAVEDLDAIEQQV